MTAPQCCGEIGLSVGGHLPERRFDHFPVRNEGRASPHATMVIHGFDPFIHGASPPDRPMRQSPLAVEPQAPT